MGGWNQSQAHAQFIADLADFKMNIQAALEAPRFSKHSFGGCDVMMENRIPQKVRDELAAKGHQIALKGTFSRSEEHTSELQSQSNLVCRLLLEKKKKNNIPYNNMLLSHIPRSTLT